MEWTVKNICVLIAIILFFFIYIIFAIIMLHHRFYPYWRTQPVAWTTVMPTREGIIQTAWHNPPRAHVALPPTMELQTRAFPVPEREAERIARFLNRHGSHRHDGELSSSSVRAAGAWYLLTDRRSGKVLGTLSHAPLAVDTAIHSNLRCQWLDNMCVHPKHQGRALCTRLMDAAIAASCVEVEEDAQSGGGGKRIVPPVGLFMSERPLPFANAATFERMACTLTPSLLVDNGSTTHRRIRSARELPHKAAESSDVRIRGGRTLEPSTAGRQLHWARVLLDPRSVVLAVDGTDWIHLSEEAVVDTDAALPFRKRVYVRGFSCTDPTKAAMHVQSYLKRHYADDTIQLVVTAPFDREALVGNSKAMCKWGRFDVHRLYFYNYRLNSLRLHVPYTWNVY